MIMNCNGVKGPSKQAAFLAALDIHRPDVVLGCESKLCNSIIIIIMVIFKCYFSGELIALS